MIQYGREGGLSEQIQQNLSQVDEVLSGPQVIGRYRSDTRARRLGPPRINISLEWWRNSKLATTGCAFIAPVSTVLEGGLQYGREGGRSEQITLHG